MSPRIKVYWGLRHEVLRMIYSGAILPILPYGAQVWIDSMQRNSNASKLRKINRMTKIKIANAYRNPYLNSLSIIYWFVLAMI
jgi:hypothetical protein